MDFGSQKSPFGISVMSKINSILFRYSAKAQIDSEISSDNDRNSFLFDVRECRSGRASSEIIGSIIIEVERHQ